MTTTKSFAAFSDVTGDENATYISKDSSNMSDSNVSMATVASTEKSKYGSFGPLEEYDQFWAAYHLNTYYLWIIFAFGFPGNIASLVTILRIRPWTSSTAYVAALALADNFAILDKIIYHQLTMHDVPIGPGGCQTLFYFGSFFSMYANWILVAMTVERFIAIWFPLRVSTFCTGRKAAIMMTVIAIVILSADLQFFWTATDTYSPSVKRDCGYKKEYVHFISHYWYWIDGCLYAIVPCILLVFFNFLIIFGIKRSGRIQKDLTNSKSDQMAEKFRQQRQITIMLVVVSIVFVLLVLPNCLFFIIKPYWKYKPVSEDHAVFILVNQIIFVLSDSNHAVNFYLYFLTARRFRRRFFDTICCRRMSKRPFTSVVRTAHSNISTTSIYTTPGSANGNSNGNNNTKL